MPCAFESVFDPSLAIVVLAAIPFVARFLTHSSLAITNSEMMGAVGTNAFGLAAISDSFVT